jgi:hypothetical protein
VLAAFDGGAPAIVHNRYGKGQTFLCGLMAGLSYSGWFSYSTWGHYLPYGGPSTRLTAELMTRPAEVAKVRRHVFTTRQFLQTAVWDGPAHSVVFINNMCGELKNEPVAAALPKPPKSAYSSTGRELAWTYADGQAKFSISLPNGYGEIVVFRYE